MIRVTCAQCGLQILVPPSVQGAVGTCFGCGSRLVVPAAFQSPVEHDLVFAVGARVADRYVIEEQIGKGGMGAVYRAHDHLVNETVALKFMNPRLLQTQRGQQLFLREAQIARRLRHDHIVAVHDVSRTQEGILFLSMECIEGHSLREFLRGRRKQRRLLSVRLAVRLISQVLEALEYAHRFVVHRDIKPENIMLLPGEQTKVLDFGLAKAVDADATSRDLSTQPGRVVGTTAYASPEQKLHQSVDLRADLYSSGLLLHELLTLRTPLDKPVKVEEARDDVAPSLLAVLEKSIRETKENRWQSAGDFRKALRGAYRESYRPAISHSEAGGGTGEASSEGMVFQEGGSFLMGSNDLVEEGPEFEAYVDPFYIDMCPVTVSQYAAFLRETGHPPPRFWGGSGYSGEDQPVIGVTWSDAQAYADWAGKALPTEVQWEFAARGKENRRYPWGNIEPDPTRANYGDHLNMPSIVGMHDDGRTPEGVHDLAGNVYEWTRDWYEPYSQRHRRKNGSDMAPRRVARGGSWHSTAAQLRCSHRKGLFPETQEATVGFRCVVAVRSEDDLT